MKNTIYENFIIFFYSVNLILMKIEFKKLENFFHENFITVFKSVLHDCSTS